MRIGFQKLSDLESKGLVLGTIGKVIGVARIAGPAHLIQPIVRAGEAG